MASAGSYTLPRPQVAQVPGMNCMGPSAPAELDPPGLDPGTRPWLDSTLPTAANTDQGTR